MQEIDEKAKHIRALILDVDGTLTSGTLYYNADGSDTLKTFHVHDGVGIKLLQKMGISVAIISAKKSEPLLRRIQDLGIQHAYLGHEDKRPAYEELKKILRLNDAEIAYMGDDLPDLPLLIRVGLSAAAQDASEIVKQHVDFISKNKAGQGAVREVCELLLKAQDQYQLVIQSYLIK